MNKFWIPIPLKGEQRNHGEPAKLYHFLRNGNDTQSQCQVKSPGLDKLTSEFFPIKLWQVLVRIFQKIKETEKLPNSFYEANITVTPRSDRDTTQKKGELHSNNTDKHRCICYQYNTENRIQHLSKR